MDPFEAKLVAAATGSTLTALTMTPFDVVKTRLQTQRPASSTKGPLLSRLPPNTCCQPTDVACVRGLSVRSMSSLAARTVAHDVVCVWDHGRMRTERVNGFSDAVLHVVRAEGIRGLWKGAGTSLVIGVPSATCHMLTYDYLNRELLPPLLPSPTLVPLTAGILARSCIVSIASPLELIRTNLQSTPISEDNPHTLRSVLTSIRGLARNHGIHHLWRGLGPTLWRDVPFSGLYWAGYEGLKREFSKRGRTGAWVAFVCGATSGTSAALLTSPFDVLKTRRQALVMTGASDKVSHSLALIQQIVRTEGMGALYAGLGPRIAKIAPACGIMISCFEGVGRFLVKKEEP
ncbi:mitochondrial carrier [Dentipellis sp. KUC8613]|nr:mitochondrial carrier [Dentipellis sp. KUC8613]